MPFPPKKVFIDYIGLYEEMRAEERDSVTTLVKTGLEYAASLYSGNKPVVNQIDGQITSIKTAIYAANEFDDWFRLIQKARITADKFQKLKTRNNGLALSCRTLHGLASLIISEMYADDNFKPLLEKKILELEAKIQKLEKDKAESIISKSGRLVPDYNKEIDLLIKELASLSQIRYIDRAVQNKLFEYLPTPSEVDVFNYAGNEGNCVGPLELQQRYCRWLYANEFQTTRKHIGFDDFIKRSIKSFHEQEANERENTARAAALAAAEAAAEDDIAPSPEQDPPPPPATDALIAAASNNNAASSATVSKIGVFAASGSKPAAARKGKNTKHDSANDDQSPQAAAAVSGSSRPR